MANIKKGKIAYRFETPEYPGNILYVNLIAKYSCINDCLFCSRPRTKEDIGKANIYEKKADSFLYLPNSPSIDEIMESIDKEIKKDDEELAIIGLGEPLIYFPKVIEVIKKVKENYKIKTRIDTNGLIKCMFDNPTQKLEKAGLDEIRISLNETNKEDYNKLCRPRFKNAYKKLIEFVKECNNSTIDTYVSFVIDFIKSKSREEYTNYALSLGRKKENIILRKYVPPIE